jgi:hypothetical protein
MKAATRARRLAPVFLVTAFVVGAWASSAWAQKQGGSITVGQELDIPGFDPLKVGVFDTSAETAAAAIFDTLTYLDDNGEPQPSLRCPGAIPRTTRPGPSSCVPGSSSMMARRSMRKQPRKISTDGRIRPTNAAARFTFRRSMMCRRLTS